MMAAGVGMGVASEGVRALMGGGGGGGHGGQAPQEGQQQQQQQMAPQEQAQPQYAENYAQ